MKNNSFLITVFLVIHLIFTCFSDSLAAEYKEESNLSVDQAVRKSIEYYQDVSNWIWHAKTSGRSVCDHVAMTFRCLDMMETNLNLLILEKLNSGKFSDALSVRTFFDKISESVPSCCYTWASPKDHVKSVLPKLDKYIIRQSSNFFTTLLETKQFEKARSLASAYKVIDSELSAKWIKTIQETELIAQEAERKREAECKEQALAAAKINKIKEILKE